ncbi:MAG: hypothetical protein E3J25_08490 [Anaerolineales bacterium]|nr:MAG: hypothetical protein E3J25_08490 [Anaerolineales bacterium]
MALKLKNWKVIAAIAGIVAVAVVVAVLILGTLAEPDNAVAILDGERITTEDVAQLQARQREWYGFRMDEDEALEEIIADRLLYREAERQGHLPPTEEETERELQARLAAMNVTLESWRALLGFDDSDYAEYLRLYRRQLAVESYLETVIDVDKEDDEELFFEKVRELVADLKSQANLEYR